MFKKITIITAVIALVITVFYAITLLKNRGVSRQPEEKTEITPTISPDGQSLFLPSADPSSPLLVPNFFSPSTNFKPVQVIEDSTSGSKTAVLKEAENYSLYGFTGVEGSSFLLTLHSDNLRQARIDGERDLLTMLGLTESQACTTNIRVAILSPFDTKISENDVRPSFCTGRIDLPSEGASAAEGETRERMGPSPDAQL